MQARLHIEAPATEAVALWDWLRNESDLRGRVARAPQPSSPGSMGTAADLVVTLATSSTAAVLARSIQVWLTQRHRDITLTVTGPDGRTVSLDARRVQPGEVEPLIRVGLGLTENPSTASGGAAPVAPVEP